MYFINISKILNKIMYNKKDINKFFNTFFISLLFIN
jgi:hypothetical protein